VKPSGAVTQLHRRGVKPGGRIVKAVQNTGRLDATITTNMMATRRSRPPRLGSGAQAARGGTGYIDELVQVAVNADPVADDLCDVRYWAMADANFNVLGSSMPPGCCASGTNTSP
jgi:hypothetical protein